MGRRAKLEPPVHVHLKLPAPLVGKINLLLWSDIHGRVPIGKLSEFFEIAVREKLDRIQSELKVPLIGELGDGLRTATTSED